MKLLNLSAFASPMSKIRNVRSEPREPWKWTPEREAKLTELWNQGYSGGAIASMIGAPTRNTCIGKIHRLGLSGRVTKRRKNHSSYKPRPKKPSGWQRAILKDNTQRLGPKLNLPLEPMPCPHAFDQERLPHAKSLTDLADRGECKFPITTVKDGKELHLFCALPAVEGQVYCPVHFRRCFSAVETRVREQIAAREKVDA